MSSSNFHYTIDLNEDQNHQTFFSPLGSSFYHNHHHHHHHHHHQAPSNISSSSSSPSLSYLPFLINSHQDQVHVGYNNNKNTSHGFLDPHLSQSLETTKFVSNDGSLSRDKMVLKKETRPKLMIMKKDNHQDQIDLPQYPAKLEAETNSLRWFSSKVRLMKKKKTIINSTDNNKQHVKNDQPLNISNLEEDHLSRISKNQCNIIINENGYNGSNNCVVRICSDCNTTKTPLWRSGPRGPKSLCNACGIRQRKARQAALAASTATATATSGVSITLLKKKTQNKNKRSKGLCKISSPFAPKVKNIKRMITNVEQAVLEVAIAGDLDTQSKFTAPSSSPTSSSSNKFDFDDLVIILNKSSAYQQVFPQDEKEAAILLMALSYGMVHG